MKKKLLSLALALMTALTLLPVTAFAAGSSFSYTTRYDLPGHADHALFYKPGTYQIRQLQRNTADAYAYAAAASYPLAAEALPLDTTIEISGLRTPTDFLTIHAWSDPDNDGIYDQRIFHSTSTSKYLVPLTERGPFTDSGDVIYTTSLSSINLGLTGEPDSSTYSVTLTTDQLCELFGSNTILQLHVIDMTDFSSTMLSTILLTGDSIFPFTDVPNWCSSAVNWAVESGITVGTGNNKFSPNNRCSKAQFLTFLYRAVKEAALGTNPYRDAPYYYSDGLGWAHQKGLIGADLDYTAYCTRANAVKYIWQVMGSKAPEGSASFSDVPDDADYAAAVAWAVENGIVEGYTDGTFRPDTVCNRGVIVTMLHRAYVPEVRLSTK